MGEKMTVLAGFSEYVDGVEVHHAKGDEIAVPAERAEQMREAGLARSKPSPKASTNPDKAG
ncbi:hypothetical protein [Mangrovibrevibacter kandeliae]|uniref:hypothetical protein n=1 Tax=Mangrovibrevibacter kandeliae TaxID=2968473 RepID=UPI0021175100|nr:hypothetical protein [Aurantimonas sp. CSK15Z-1]MCQ8781721.1 hypothetical protein [Aurantimonas sp. CSK15Z-1]